MQWLEAAMTFMAIASALLAGTFAYVHWRFVRRRYVLLWALAYTVAIPHVLLSLASLSGTENHGRWAAQQLFLILNATLMVAGAYEFVHRRVPVRWLVTLAAPFAAWALVAPFLTQHPLALMLPSSVLLAASYGWTATRFVRLARERGTQGAQVVAVLFALAGLHELDFPLLANHRWGGPVGYAVAASLALMIALFLLVMILEEARAEAAAEKERLGAILDTLPVGVVVAGTGGSLSLANAALRSLLARSPSSVPGEEPARDLLSGCLRLVDGSACAHDDHPVEIALRTRESVVPRQMIFATGDGAKIPVLVHAGPVRNARGEIEGAVAVVQNITELVRLQEEVARSQRLQGLGTLAAGVAHDFNNALAMILGNAELASETAVVPEVKKRLTLIIQIASDAAAIVRRMQDLARTRASRDEVPTDLAAILRDVYDISEPRWRGEARSAGRDYDVVVDAEHPLTVLAEPSELREALLNMVLNALDAMPDGGRLVMALKREGEHAVIRLSDTGVGMPPEVRERIFEPYFTTKGEQGNGMGLAVVFSILQRHGAAVTVSSEPGAGTTFVMAFPLMAVPGHEAVSATPAAAPERKRILVVDDEASLGDLTAKMLRLQGHQVHVARSGGEALEHVGTAELDLVLTDLGMPGMTGWDLAAEVRRLRPGLRIVLMTGWGNALSDEQARAGGVDAVISKPFSREALVKMVDADQ